ncbi:MAG: glycosyltransferase family 2 protein [Candidatus Gastranaerophilaceae bacterium]|jgi:GT2 family glycosyltransferase
MNYSIKTSIIILTYNELQAGTIPCVESIYKYTDINDFELIIIDNASRDNTPRYLQELKEKYNNVKIQLNAKNKGFPAGMNDGLKLADGEFLVLLNNDILVTPDWLNDLLAPLKTNSEIGLVGPLSNNVGTEQRIDIEGLDKNNYVDYTREYLNRHKREIFFTKRICFSCVALRHDVFENIGFLDENFGIGFYEDDDYCLRILKAGYKLAVAEGCFIYHQGSLSFDKANRDHGLKNELYLCKKHNFTWTGTVTAIAYLNKIKDDLLKYQSTHSALDPNLEKIMVRLKGFEDYLAGLNKFEIKARKRMKPTFLERFKRGFSAPERFIRKQILKKT